MIDSLAAPRAVQFELKLDVSKLTTSKPLLETVLRNLIGNAIKHGATKGGRVTVSSGRSDDCVTFRVADNGPGVAPEYHERIFEMFQTLRSRDKVEGSGMGLAIVRKIITAQGGAIWIDSRPSEGATFSFTWPTQIVQSPHPQPHGEADVQPEDS